MSTSDILVPAEGLTAFSALAWSAPVTLACIYIGAALGLRQLIHGLPGFTPGLNN